MARDSKISFGDVAKIADQMQAAGQRVTARAVRERLGSGSMGTILQHIQQWKGAAPASGAATIELPESIAKLLMDFVSTEVATGMEPLQEELTELRAELNVTASENVHLYNQLALAAKDNETRLKEIAHMRGMVESQGAMIDEKARREREDAALIEQLKQENALMAERLRVANATRTELEMAREKLEKLTSEKMHLAEQVASLSAKLEASAGSLAEANSERYSLRDKLKNAERAVDACQARLEGAAREIDGLGKRVEALQKRIDAGKPKTQRAKTVKKNEDQKELKVEQWSTNGD